MTRQNTNKRWITCQLIDKKKAAAEAAAAAAKKKAAAAAALAKRIAGTSCVFSRGDGTGGYEKRLDNVPTKEACMKQVMTKYPKANGVTYGVSRSRRTRCYAEFGMKRQNTNRRW